MTMKPSPRIELEIDALVLDGLSPREGALFAAAFRDELTRRGGSAAAVRRTA